MKSEIDLPRAVLTDEGEDLVVRHKGTGTVKSVSKKQLDNWCIAQLRALMSDPVVPEESKTT